MSAGSSQSVWPMPRYCAPWPVKRNAIGGGCIARLPTTISGRARPSARSAMRSRSCSRVAAMIAARCRWRPRPVLVVHATSSTGTDGSASSASPVSRARSRIAASVLAVTVTRWSGCSIRVRGTIGSRASSTTMCAFVPPNPKLLMPANRGRGPIGQGSIRVGIRSGVPSIRMRGFSSLKLICG